MKKIFCRPKHSIGYILPVIPLHLDIKLSSRYLISDIQLDIYVINTDTGQYNVYFTLQMKV